MEASFRSASSTMFGTGVRLDSCIYPQQARRCQAQHRSTPPAREPRAARAEPGRARELGPDGGLADVAAGRGVDR